MKNIFSILFRCIKWLLSGIAIIALVVLACWILLPDETLNPDAQRIIEAKPTVPPEQNAYYALWGLKASPELAAADLGRALLKTWVLPFEIASVLLTAALIGSIMLVRSPEEEAEDALA